MAGSAGMLTLAVLTSVLMACASAPHRTVPLTTPPPAGPEAAASTTALEPPAPAPAPPASPPFSVPPLVPPATDAASPGPPAAPAPAATVWPPADNLAERPLAALSPAAAAYLTTRAGAVGIAVVVPGRQAVYTANGDQPFHMASVAKLVLLLAVLDRSMREDRELTPAERALVEPMITVSDNDAATTLWTALGGAPGLDAYLQAIGVAEILPNHGDAWGASWATPRAVAVLLAKLAGGELLDAPRRAYALQLLSAVTPEQRWGVTAGIPDTVPEGTVIGLKDGWYPADCGWWVNSAGALLPGNDRPAYTIAVLTAEQPSREYGIATIEGLSDRVHAVLHP